MNLYALKQEFLDYLYELCDTYNRNRYCRYIILLGLMIGASILLYLGYSTFNKRKLESVSASLMECIMKFNETTSSETPNWDDVINLCTEKKKIHGSSPLAPYFTFICSDALLKKGNFAESLELMKEVAHSVQSNDIAPLIKTKYALMLLDSTDELMRSQGVEKLTALAEDTSNKSSDMAQYHLGRYFFAINDHEKAKEIWVKLVSNTVMTTIAPSPWVTLAQQKLNQLL